MLDEVGGHLAGEHAQLAIGEVLLRLVGVAIRPPGLAQIIERDAMAVRVGDRVEQLQEVAEHIDLLGRLGHFLFELGEYPSLEARNVRLLTPDWWNGYGPKSAPELAVRNIEGVK